MKYLKIGVAVAAAAATVAAVTAAVQSPEQKTAGTVAASAANSDSPAAIRASILDGTLWRTHKVVNSCAGPKKYRIGCDFGLLSASGDASKPANTAQPAGLGPDDLARAFHLPHGQGEGRDRGHRHHGPPPEPGVRPGRLPQAVRAPGLYDRERLPEGRR